MGPDGIRPHSGATPGNGDEARPAAAGAKRRRSRKKRRQHGAGGAGAATGGQAAQAAASGRNASELANGGLRAADDSVRTAAGGSSGADARRPGDAPGGGKRRGKKRRRPNRAERRAQVGKPDLGPSAGETPGNDQAGWSRSDGGGVDRNWVDRGGAERSEARAQPEAASDALQRRPANTDTVTAVSEPSRAGTVGRSLELAGLERAASGPAAPAGTVAERSSGDPRSGEARDVRSRPAREGRHGTAPGAVPDRLYAALDLGTNNCRLLVARPEQRGFRVVDAYSRIVRLGEGLGHANRLGEAAMDRALEALVCCRDKMRDRGVERARLIATEACRAAENGPQFIERVRQETGMSLEIASRETEARLAVAGCASLVDPDANGVVLFDIGGGSSEIVWLDLRNRCGARGVALTRFIRAWISLPVGVVNLAERHGGRHVTSDTFEAMVNDAREHLEAFSLGRELSAAICDGKVHMLGTSGTVTTLAGVHFGLKRYDRRRIDGVWMDDEDVTAMIERLRAMPYEERVGNPCIGADRADLVLAGCAILESIRRRWPCQRLRVADRGLREGILMELMAADNVWRRNAPHRHRSRSRKQQ
jgi:exopolyphosphatase/guanosine-5'-triphosphate,3'-diphosphate pyrophosphatase